MSAPDPMNDVILINPDCRDGKHGSCSGGWNVDADMPDECPCTCHPPGCHYQE